MWSTQMQVLLKKNGQNHAVSADVFQRRPSRPFHFPNNRTLCKRFIFLLNNHQRQTNETRINPSLPKLNKSCLLLIVSAGLVLTYGEESLVFGGENFYRKYAMHLVHSPLDGEDAHRLAVFMAKWNLVPIDLMVRRVFDESFLSATEYHSDAD